MNIRATEPIWAIVTSCSDRAGPKQPIVSTRAPHPRAVLLAHEVAGVPAGVLLQVVLVVLLRRRERARGDDLGDDRSLPRARLRRRAPSPPRRRVRWLSEVTKIAERYWVPTSLPWRLSVVGSCMLEEPLLEQILVAQHRRIEHDAHRFGVARASGVDVVVRRACERSRRCSRPRFRSRRASRGGSPPCPRSSRPRG